MKIVIIGNGLVGSQLASRLAGVGRDVTALGRGDGIDTTTGEGLERALAGAEVAVDLTDSPTSATTRCWPSSATPVPTCWLPGRPLGSATT